MRRVKREAFHSCQRCLGTEDDHVNRTYAAWPTRLYLIGIDGRVVYAGGLGPYDFKPAKLKAAIENYLSELILKNESAFMI